MKHTFEDLTLPGLVLRLKELKEAEGILDGAQDSVSLEREATEQLLLADMESLGMPKAQFEGLGTASARDEIYVSIEDRSKALAWITQEHPEMLTFNYQQLSSLVKARLQDQEITEPVPPGLKTFFKQSITLYKEK